MCFDCHGVQIRPLLGHASRAALCLPVSVQAEASDQGGIEYVNFGLELTRDADYGLFVGGSEGLNHTITAQVAVTL